MSASFVSIPKCASFIAFFLFYHSWLQSPLQPQCISEVVLCNTGNFCLVWGCLLGKTYDDLSFRMCYKLEAWFHLTAVGRAAVGREALRGVPGSDRSCARASRQPHPGLCCSHHTWLLCPLPLCLLTSYTVVSSTRIPLRIKQAQMGNTLFPSKVLGFLSKKGFSFHTQ